MTTQLSTYKPSLSLSRLVQTYWTGDFNLYAEDNVMQSVLPNGCIELIIHLTTDHCELIKDNAWGITPDFTLIGLQTQAYQVRFKRRVQVFGIRFNPESIYTIFGVPASSFTAAFGSSKDILGQKFADYCSRIREAASTDERIVLTENFLLQHLANQSGNRDYVRIALEIIRKHNGRIRLDELMKQVYISPRQLQREFKNRMGITAKEYMRLSRFNAIQKYMLGADHLNLTGLCYKQGFADQSHFIREFKLLAGANPSEFLKSREKFIANPALHGARQQ